MKIKFLVLIFQSIYAIDHCIWTSPNGIEFDLNKLTRSDHWKVSQKHSDSELFKMEYFFNFCSPVKMECKGKQVYAMEKLSIFSQSSDGCTVLGQGKEKIIELLDDNDASKGIKIKYPEGDVCSDSEKMLKPRRSISFVIRCSPYWDDDFIETSQSSEKCDLEFTFQSPIGCGGKSHSFFNFSLRLILQFILFVYLIYMAIGFYKNLQNPNLQGLQLIPHFDTHVNCFKYNMQIIQSIFQFLITKMGFQNTERQQPFPSNSRKSYQSRYTTI